MLNKIFRSVIRAGVKFRGRAFFLAVGIAVEEIVANAFDYALYPFVVWKYGLVKGGVMMALFSLAFCYATLIVYNLTKKDWFGIELLKELREYKGRGKIFGAMSWILKKGQVASFVFLSLKFDPFTTVAYIRTGANEFPKMDCRAWKIFFGSWLLGNLSWLAVVFTGVSLVKVFWETVH
ncbi:MAG: hypothetical protein NT026_02995 [Candidatus Staskawiczbacteria bacterium]|nr:hypothetical protein [Candidatus Staskawiczbacteria bacterium]